MSTSDQQEHGPLTRKQLREIRLTGSTPVISAEEAAAAAAAASAPPEPPLPSDAEPEETPPAAAPIDATPEETSPAVVPDAEVVTDSAPLTRRQVREQERIKTASVPVVGVTEDFAAEEAPRADAPIDADTADADDVVAVPSFSAPEQPDDTHGDEAGSEPAPEEDAVAAVAALGIEVEYPEEVVDEDDENDVLADADGAEDDSDIAADERPTVSPMFGQGVLTEPEEPQKPFTPSFDELLTVGDSTGSQSVAPNTLIFTPGPGDGSLSGPVASTGEILVTGSYELPKGLGSRGHAHGTTDGKEVDAVLIDGELPPASSPTPIAASAAVSTIKPAGEVIRPPAPEKGNKLMLTLAIVTGGLALAVAIALIVAFTTNVF